MDKMLRNTTLRRSKKKIHAGTAPPNKEQIEPRPMSYVHLVKTYRDLPEVEEEENDEEDFLEYFETAFNFVRKLLSIDSKTDSKSE
mmetsp:Transcript_20031/g.33065  ORF Transcript_20031/g.33065 Transcript_20031/m.33065 type:complete len:86 (-) Transcript_20031:2609-2866(-)